MQNPSTYRQIPGYVIFEGVDGCGKSTVIKNIAEKCVSAGKPPRLIKEPGTTKIGKELRNILIDNPGPSRTEALLFLANRVDISIQLGFWARTQSGIFLSDRGFPSMIRQWSYPVAQGDPSSLEWLWDLHERTCFSLAFPQAVVWINPNVRTILGRLAEREKAENLTALEHRYLYTSGLLEEDMAKYAVIMDKIRKLDTEVIQVNPLDTDPPEKTSQEIFDRLVAIKVI